jgi:serine-type D-Ala-D-Ala carboxypeptidase/endopeptidase (penicillin-binding protein 4)
MQTINFHPDTPVSTGWASQPAGIRHNASHDALAGWKACPTSSVRSPGIFGWKLAGRLKLPVFLLLLLLLALPCLAHAARGKTRTPATAATAETPVEKLNKAAGEFGFQIVSLPTGKVISELRSKESLVPASLVKVLTSFAALKKLGPQFRFKTEVYALKAPQGGVISGDVWIRGSGDPYFLSEKAKDFARQLAHQGIRRIEGNVIADLSFFEPAAERICLDANCEAGYNPVVSAAALDFNTLMVRVTPSAIPGKPARVDWLPPGDYVRIAGGAATVKKNAKASVSVRQGGPSEDGKERILVSGQVPARSDRVFEYRANVGDPAVVVSGAFKAMLKDAGIAVAGTGKPGKTPPGAVPIATYESPPLSEFLYGLNRHSNNFMAEMLLRSVGGYVLGPPGSAEKGIAVIRAALDDASIPDVGFGLDCGSGLSRICRVSPETFCGVLTALYRDPSVAADFWGSLAENGHEGTLRRRSFRPGIKVWGKTGTLNDVVGFAGYVSGPSGNMTAVTVILNHVRDRWKARQAIDSLLEQTAIENR